MYAIRYVFGAYSPPLAFTSLPTSLVGTANLKETVPDYSITHSTKCFFNHVFKKLVYKILFYITCKHCHRLDLWHLAVLCWVFLDVNGNYGGKKLNQPPPMMPQECGWTYRNRRVHTQRLQHPPQRWLSINRSPQLLSCIYIHSSFWRRVNNNAVLCCSNIFNQFVCFHGFSLPALIPSQILFGTSSQI